MFVKTAEQTTDEITTAYINIGYDDFRGIAISLILSKVFEYCFINKFGKYLYTDEKQFGFKKGVGCTHVIYIPSIKLWNL